MKCSRCGTELQGKFCSNCGLPARAHACTGCGAKLTPGARFCTQCGVAIGASGSRRQTSRANAGWWAAGALFFVLIVVAALPLLQEGGGDSPSSQPTDTPTGSSEVDLSSMTPREIADRLFNRVMSAAESGDSAEVELFLPKAITSYEKARPLDADGLYHLALLQKTSGNHQASLAAAREALDDVSGHLLNLSAAAEAAANLGDTQAATAYYTQLLEVFDEEIAADRREYRIHSRIVSRLKPEAQTFLRDR